MVMKTHVNIHSLKSLSREIDQPIELQVNITISNISSFKIGKPRKYQSLAEIKRSILLFRTGLFKLHSILSHLYV